MTIIVTGGAGFIGSNFLDFWLQETSEEVVNIDNLTLLDGFYNIRRFSNEQKYNFVKADICDESLITEIIKKYKPRAILNFAAETHVDRSILDPRPFVNSNIVGTSTILNCAKTYWSDLPKSEKIDFRFIQISTDEVYGSLGVGDSPFTELTCYRPRNPYSASKAAGDHLVSSYCNTFGFPAIITHCSNNFGPFQFREKLIPNTILNALEKKAIPIYGDGSQIRDWLFVGDHCRAIKLILDGGNVGEIYNIGGGVQKSNKEVVNQICSILDRIQPLYSDGDRLTYNSLITHVHDRPGHDVRYDIDSSKLTSHLGWSVTKNFDIALEETVIWYFENKV